MEATIRTNDRNLFEALLLFLKTLNISIETRMQTEKALPKERIKKTKSTLASNDFQKLLLNGPVMSDDDYNYFQEKKLDFNRWK